MAQGGGRWQKAVESGGSKGDEFNGYFSTAIATSIGRDVWTHLKIKKVNPGFLCGGEE